ncbi:site-specific integrase [Alicyclobacillus sp. SO9]|uniref:tyrosine-type recombinase/integrase n=1 Tax=Alicyclobacillus sp. SO9 TaxID=2665646 RepID=UPI0018E6E3D3|nr:site-specific integrase [Alicyclobacillus sp. SO9]QQE77322.1 site-specific integrase [Alicyclobacillus sp. SO9]
MKVTHIHDRTLQGDLREEYPNEYEEAVGADEPLRNPRRYQYMPEIRTLSDAVEFAEQVWRRRNPGSLKTYLRHVREFQRWAYRFLAHPCVLERIDRFDLARYRWWLENRGTHQGDKLAPSSVQLKMDSIAALYKVLVSQGVVEPLKNPVRSLESEHVRRARKRRRPNQPLRLSIENLQRLVSLPREAGYLGLRDEVLLLTQAFWGLRPVEITWLKLSSLTESTLYFERAKHNYPGSFWVTDPYRNLFADMEHQYGLQPYHAMFLSQYKTPISTRSVEKIIHRYGEKIGLLELTPRDFRVTLETFLDEHYTEAERDAYMGYIPQETARGHYVRVPDTTIQHMFETWVELILGSSEEHHLV